MLQHFLRVEVGDQEGDVVALDGFPPQDEEGLGALRQEAGEFVDKDLLDFVGLLDFDADADAVDARLDEDTLILVARNGQRGQEDLGRCASLNLGDIVSLSSLGSEVGEAEGGRETAAHSLEVGAEGLRLP